MILKQQHIYIDVVISSQTMTETANSTPTTQRFHRSEWLTYIGIVWLRMISLTKNVHENWMLSTHPSNGTEQAQPNSPWTLDLVHLPVHCNIHLLLSVCLSLSATHMHLSMIYKQWRATFIIAGWSIIPTFTIINMQSTRAVQMNNRCLGCGRPPLTLCINNALITKKKKKNNDNRKWKACILLLRFCDTIWWALLNNYTWHLDDLWNKNFLSQSNSQYHLANLQFFDKNLHLEKHCCGSTLKIFLFINYYYYYYTIIIMWIKNIKSSYNVPNLLNDVFLSCFQLPPQYSSLVPQL